MHWPAYRGTFVEAAQLQCRTGRGAFRRRRRQPLSPTRESVHEPRGEKHTSKRKRWIVEKKMVWSLPQGCNPEKKRGKL